MTGDNQIQLSQEQPIMRVTDNSPFANMTAFETAQRMAQAIITSTMVPEHYQGKENLGNALIALEMSQRLGASLLMVCQNLYVVYGNPAWSSKFKIATFNQCGRFSAIRYEWADVADRKHDDYGCRATAIELATGEVVRGPWITWALVKAEGWDSRKDRNGRMSSKWLTMPEKMFMYRAASWMIDAIAPEISMGLQTEDEVRDVIDIDAKTGEIIGGVEPATSAAEALREKINVPPQPVEAEAEKRQAKETVVDAVDPAEEDPDAKKAMTGPTKEFLEKRIEQADNRNQLRELSQVVANADLAPRTKGSLNARIDFKTLNMYVDDAITPEQLDYCRSKLQEMRLNKQQHSAISQAISEKAKTIGNGQDQQQQEPPPPEADNGRHEEPQTTEIPGPAGREQQVLEKYENFVGLIDMADSQQALDELENDVTRDSNISIFEGQVLKKRIRNRWAQFQTANMP